MSYVAAATRLHGWDAIHMFQACRLARQLGRSVVIATADGDFDTLIEVFPDSRTWLPSATTRHC
jgi:hypothetical protein